MADNPMAEGGTPMADRAEDQAAEVEREAQTVIRLFEMVGVVTAGAGLAVMQHPDVVEGGLALAESIARRLRETR